MTPTDFAREAHSKLSLFRDQRDAVAEHARNMRRVHVLTLPPMTCAGDGGVEAHVALASSPAQLSDKLLNLLFGDVAAARPNSRCALRSKRPGLVVSEVEWSEWVRAAASNDG